MRWLAHQQGYADDDDAGKVEESEADEVELDNGKDVEIDASSGEILRTKNRDED